jgi:hypothetical protein
MIALSFVEKEGNSKMSGRSRWKAIGRADKMHRSLIHGEGFAMEVSMIAQSTLV